MEVSSPIELGNAGAQMEAFSTIEFGNAGAQMEISSLIEFGNAGMWPLMFRAKTSLCGKVLISEL